MRKALLHGVARIEPRKLHSRSGDVVAIITAPDRDATIMSVLAYAGLRPSEALALTWGHAQERTLVANTTKMGQRRSVRLLDALAGDLAKWKLLTHLCVLKPPRASAAVRSCARLIGVS
jgi:integrase